MADIVYSFDLDADVTFFGADSAVGDRCLGRHAVTIPNVELPGRLAKARSAGLRGENLHQVAGCVPLSPEAAR